MYFSAIDRDGDFWFQCLEQKDIRDKKVTKGCLISLRYGDVSHCQTMQFPSDILVFVFKE